MYDPFGTPKTVTAATYNQLEAILLENFPGIDPDLIAREEWGNDQEHSFNVTGNLGGQDTTVLALYIQGRWTTYGTTQVLLDALCLRGVIPAGEYLIDVSW